MKIPSKSPPGEVRPAYSQDVDPAYISPKIRQQLGVPLEAPSFVFEKSVGWSRNGVDFAPGVAIWNRGFNDD